MSRDWDWIVRGFYANDVESPKVPGDLAIETVHRGESSRDLEQHVLEARPDIGRVEVLPYDRRSLWRGRMT